MEILGLVISILSISFTLYTYFKHDALIKKQSVLLNKYQLEKIEKEKLNDKKAIIEANVIKGDKGKRILKIYNKGNSIAKDVMIYFLDDPDFSYDDLLFPIDIKPKNSIDINLWTFKGSPDKVKITFEWSDDFLQKNTDSQTIQI